MSSRQPQPRDRHAAVGFEQKLYIWEGDAGDSAKIQNSAIDVFDLSSETWSESQKLRGSLPADLQGVAVTTDGEFAYSFGGTTGGDENYSFLNAVYKVQLSTLECKEVLQKNCAHAPTKKCDCGVVYFNDMLVIYGGWTDGAVATDELNVFDIRKGVWMAPSAEGEKPPPLHAHTFTKIDRSRAVVFGGIFHDLKCCGTYVLDMNRWKWTKLEVTGDQPRNREYHAACCIAGPLTGQEHPLLMVVGGITEFGTILDDVWILDVDESRWTKVTLPAVINPRHSHSAVVFEKDSFKVVVLFGGKQPSRLLGRECCYTSDTTLLLLEHRSNGGGISWEVTRVVRADLQDHLKELEMKLKQEQEKRSEAEWELDMWKKEEQRKRVETERRMELLEKKVLDLEQKIKDLTSQRETSSHPEAAEVTAVMQTAINEADTQHNPTSELVLDKDHLQPLLHFVGQAASRWRIVGVALGFDKDVLDAIHTNNMGRPMDCLTDMLSSWLKWAPPKHKLPTLGILAEALRSNAVGEERMAYNMEQGFQQKLSSMH